MTLREHLLSRHVDLDLHHAYIDEDLGVATFFLYNLSGKIVGYQQYRPSATKVVRNSPREGRYYTYRTKDTVGVFGLESLKFRDDLVFVAEGIFDAARLTKLGQPAVAVLSNDPNTDVRNFLSCLNRRIVAVTDPGRAGRKLARVGHIVENMPDEYDLGDAPESVVQELVERYKETV